MRKQKFRGNLFVANLPQGYTDEELAKAFDPYGIVISAFLARDPKTGAPKTHGLVNIAPDRAAKEAAAALNGSQVGGRHIEVRLADPNMSIGIPSEPNGGRDHASREPTYRRVAPPAATVTRTRPTFQVEHRPLRPRTVGPSVR